MSFYVYLSLFKFLSTTFCSDTVVNGIVLFSSGLFFYIHSVLKSMPSWLSLNYFLFSMPLSEFCILEITDLSSLYCQPYLFTFLPFMFPLMIHHSGSHKERIELFYIDSNIWSVLIRFWKENVCVGKFPTRQEISFLALEQYTALFAIPQIY